MKRIRFTGDMDEGNCVVAIDLLNENAIVAHEIDEVTLDIVTDIDDALRILRNRGLPFVIVGPRGRWLMISDNHTDHGDRDIEEMLDEIDQLVQSDHLVFLKWTCPSCGERCVADEPNKFCSRGYLHTEKADGTPCNTWYHGRMFGYLLIAKSTQEERLADRPVVKLVGEDGNAFNILGRCRHAGKEAGWTDDQWEAFQREATSGDYDHLLATVMDYFEVE